MAGSLYRDFDAEIEEADGEPITFKLGGVVFECVNPVPLGAFMVLAKNALGSFSEIDITDPQAMQDPRAIRAAGEMTGILWRFVVEEQHDELDRVISELHDVSILQRIQEHIMSAAAGRPTQGS